MNKPPRLVVHVTSAIKNARQVRDHADAEQHRTIIEFVNGVHRDTLPRTAWESIA